MSAIRSSFPHVEHPERNRLILRLRGSIENGGQLIDLTDTPWREAAACLETGGEVSFFPDKEDFAGTVKAKAICAGCPVADECLSWALETNQTDGIWGGHTAKERRSIRRRWLEEVRKAS